MKRIILIFNTISLALLLLASCDSVQNSYSMPCFSLDPSSKDCKDSFAFENNSPNKITRIVIFGDSLSYTSSAKGFFTPSPSHPFFQGRYSNGPVWNDYLADIAHVGVLNFSKGGAVTKACPNAGIEDIPRYLRDFGRSMLTGSIDKFVGEYLQENNDHVMNPDKTLFIIWAGVNDYLSKFDNAEDLKNLIDNPDMPNRGGNAIARMSADNISQEILRLYKAGARYFAIGNMPDLGVTPAVKNNKNYKKGFWPDDARKYRLSEELSRITTLHNKLLAEKIADLRKKLKDPNTKIIIFDAAQALKNLMNNIGPKGEQHFDYGINVEKSFGKLLAAGKKPLRIGQKCYLGSYLGSDDEKMICNNAKEMLFWDDIHPTTAGHCAISFLLHTVLFDQGMVAPGPNLNDYKKLCK